MKQYLVKFVTKKGGEENHEMITMANNAKEAISNVSEIWYSENTMHAFRMHAEPCKNIPDTEELTEKVEIFTYTREFGCGIYTTVEVPVGYTEEDLNNAVRERGFVKYMNLDDKNHVWVELSEEVEEPTPEQSEDASEPEPDNKPDTSETTPEEVTLEVPAPVEGPVSEVKYCTNCPECIYYEKCTSNAPERMQCKSKYPCVSLSCCADFQSRKSIDDIYEEQKTTEQSYKPNTESAEICVNCRSCFHFRKCLDSGLVVLCNMESDSPFHLVACETDGNIECVGKYLDCYQTEFEYIYSETDIEEILSDGEVPF